MKIFRCWIMMLFLFIAGKSSSQNLLVNGGFEEENICTEFDMNCAPEGWLYTVPSYFYYFRDESRAHGGKHFVALVAGHESRHFFRTFVRSRLVCGLRKGQTYRLQFYLQSDHPILDSIGVYFSSYDFLFEKIPYQKIQPSFFVSENQNKILKNKEWQLISFNYVAKGDEAFISIGNFSKLDIRGPTGIDMEKHFYFLLDDISLLPMNPNEKLCADWLKNVEDIYAQDERHEYLERVIRRGRADTLVHAVVSPTKLYRIDTLVIPDVLFTSGSSDLRPDGISVLEQIIQKRTDLMIDSVWVEGHTDSIGKSEANILLSEARASTVADYLLLKGMKNIRRRGWGSSRPVSENKTPAGRQKNRRVEVYLYLRE